MQAMMKMMESMNFMMGNVCDRLEKVGKHGKWLEHVPKTWPYRLQWLNEYGKVKVNK